VNTYVGSGLAQRRVDDRSERRCRRSPPCRPVTPLDGALDGGDRVSIVLAPQPNLLVAAPIAHAPNRRAYLEPGRRARATGVAVAHRAQSPGQHATRPGPGCQPSGATGGGAARFAASSAVRARPLGGFDRALEAVRVSSPARIASRTVRGRLHHVHERLVAGCCRLCRGSRRRRPTASARRALRRSLGAPSAPWPRARAPSPRAGDRAAHRGLNASRRCAAPEPASAARRLRCTTLAHPIRHRRAVSRRPRPRRARRYA